MAVTQNYTICQINGFIGGRIVGGPWSFSVDIIEYAMGAIGWKVLFYDKADKTQKVGELSSDLGQGVVTSITFDLVETGCGDFSIELGVDPADLPFTVEYNQGVEIYLYHDTNPWYAGYITKKPSAGSTKRPWMIKGAGYFNQLETCIIDKNYSSTEISDIVRDLMDVFIEEKTDIVYADYKILETAYTASSIKFDHVTAKKAIGQLKDLAQNFVFGVDENRELFFNGTDPTVNPLAIFAVGKHIDGFDPEEDIEDVVNRVFVKAGLLSGSPKSNIQATVSDYNSQLEYGLREKVMTAPSVHNATDAERWGQWQIDDLKKPKKKAKIGWADCSKGPIKAKGKAKVLPLWNPVYDELDHEIDHMNQLVPGGGGWVGDPSCTESSDTTYYKEGGCSYKFDWTATPNTTFKMKKGFLLDQYKDWSQYKYVRFWLRHSFPSGTWTFSFGESDYEDNNFDITSQAGTGPVAWHFIEIDISAVALASRYNVQYIQVKWVGGSIAGPDTWLDFMYGTEMVSRDRSVELGIEKVSYSVGDDGIGCSLSLGQIKKDPGRILRDILFDAANEELLQQSNMGQL